MFSITFLKLFCYLGIDKCHQSDYYSFDSECNVVIALRKGNLFI
jgi:hypothetical protein